MISLPVVSPSPNPYGRCVALSLLWVCGLLEYDLVNNMSAWHVYSRIAGAERLFVNGFVDDYAVTRNRMTSFYGSRSFGKCTVGICSRLRTNAQVINSRRFLAMCSGRHCLGVWFADTNYDRFLIFDCNQSDPARRVRFFSGNIEDGIRQMEYGLDSLISVTDQLWDHASDVIHSDPLLALADDICWGDNLGQRQDVMSRFGSRPKKSGK